MMMHLLYPLAQRILVSMRVTRRLMFVVALSTSTTNTVTFDVAIGGGTASRFADYSPLANSRVTITTGTTATIPITILADNPTIIT